MRLKILIIITGFIILSVVIPVPLRVSGILLNNSLTNNLSINNSSIITNNSSIIDVQTSTNIPDNAAGVYHGNYNSLAEINPTMNIPVLVTLKYRNLNQLLQFTKDVQTPGSSVYHHFLSKNDFIEQYAPNIAVYTGLTSYFQAQGFSVQTYEDRASLALIGSINQYDQVFHTQIKLVNDGKSTFYAPMESVSLGYNAGNNILNIEGLSNSSAAQIRPLFNDNFAPPDSPYSGQQFLIGADLQKAYQLNNLYEQSYPVGETVATILWSGQNSAGQNVGPYNPTDITYYFNHNLPTGEPQPVIYGDPIAGAPQPGSSATGSAVTENSLDLEMAGSTAPGANIVNVYGPQPTLTYLLEAFAEILSPQATNCYSDKTSGTDTYDCQNALQNVVAISNSWAFKGSPPLDIRNATTATWDQYTLEAAARGITVFASSGDNSNWDFISGQPLPSPSFPSTATYNTYGVISVGGTNTVLTGTQSTDGSATTGIQSQSAYQDGFAEMGSQGGVSALYTEPDFQQNSADANSVIISNAPTNGVTSGRGTPDIAAVAYNMIIYVYGNYMQEEGTSVASPLVAGEIASMDAFLKGREGFLDPLIYQLGEEQYNGGFTSAPPFWDVTTSGTVGHEFSASSGYDLVTGWGSINAYNFVTLQLGIEQAENWDISSNVNSQTCSGCGIWVTSDPTAIGGQAVHIVGSYAYLTKVLSLGLAQNTYTVYVRVRHDDIQYPYAFTPELTVYYQASLGSGWTEFFDSSPSVTSNTYTLVAFQVTIGADQVGEPLRFQLWTGGSGNGRQGYVDEIILPLVSPDMSTYEVESWSLSSNPCSGCSESVTTDSSAMDGYAVNIAGSAFDFSYIASNGLISGTYPVYVLARSTNSYFYFYVELRVYYQSGGNWYLDSDQSVEVTSTSYVLLLFNVYISQSYYPLRYDLSTGGAGSARTGFFDQISIPNSNSLLPL